MFSFPTVTEQRGAVSSAFTSSEAAIKGILSKKVILKFCKISKNTFSAENLRTTASFLYQILITGQQKIDLCYIKSSFRIYQLRFLKELRNCN